MPSEQVHRHVNTMLQQAPTEHVQGALDQALQALGPGGFGRSVAQAAEGMSAQQSQGLVGMLDRLSKAAVDRCLAGSVHWPGRWRGSVDKSYSRRARTTGLLCVAEPRGSTQFSAGQSDQ